MRERIPSNIRAPPEADRMMRGFRDSIERRMLRAIRSPAAEARLPPRNEKSMNATTQGICSMAPSPQRTASVSPVSSRAFFRRSVYLRESLKWSGSVETTSEKCSWKESSSRRIFT